MRSDNRIQIIAAGIAAVAVVLAAGIALFGEVFPFLISTATPLPEIFVSQTVEAELTRLAGTVSATATLISTNTPTATALSPSTPTPPAIATSTPASSTNTVLCTGVITSETGAQLITQIYMTPSTRSRQRPAIDVGITVNVIEREQDGGTLWLHIEDLNGVELGWIQSIHLPDCA